MSEFTEVMRNWRRMCDTYTTEDAARCCQGCPMDGRGCGAIYEDGNADPEVIEREVNQWAAEHPEPVYPTWLEWLKSMGVIPYMMGMVVVRDEEGHFEHGRVDIKENALKSIPADIAQKLGIEPKEG